MDRRRFLRRSSALTVGAVAAYAGAGKLQALAAPTTAAAATSNSNTATVKGITLSGLQTTATGETNKSLKEVKTEIDASKQNFGATHIRLQIQQQSLVGDGTQYNPMYAGTVYEAVNYVLDQGLTVIVNCQTEQSFSSTRTYPYPNYKNSATNQFWTYLLTSAGGGFRGHPRVICDLFNEPKCPDWGTWQSEYNGVIKHIRAELGVAVNQLWADANDYAASFIGCPGLSDPTGNLVYSFHHPPSAGSGDTGGWYDDFGRWAASHPVVNGEFAQNSNFNWNSPYQIQKYLSYLRDNGIGQTLWTVYGDDYFSDSDDEPCGWWGNMVNDWWNPDNGWSVYCFRSSVAWRQNYVVHTGNRLSWTNGLYQGWSAANSSMLVGVAGFNSFAPDMARGSQHRIHVASECVWPDHGEMTAVLGVHGVSKPPKTWVGVNPHVTNIAERSGLKKREYFSMDVPSNFFGGFATGRWKGIVFGPGPDNQDEYEGHLTFDPEVVIEVHA